MKNILASTDEGLVNENEKIKKVMSSEMLHELIEFSLMPLLDAVERGMAATSNDDKQYHDHFLLTSCIAGLPETEDLLELNFELRTNSPCLIWMVEREILGDSTSASHQDLKYFREFLRSLNCLNSKEKVYQVLNKNSVRPLLSSLSNLLVVGICSSVDIYTVLCPELMHVLLLEASELLKECRLKMLCDSERRTSSIRPSSQQNKLCKTIRKLFVSSLNLFLMKTEFLHRAAAADKFYGFSNGHIDSVHLAKSRRKVASRKDEARYSR